MVQESGNIVGILSLAFGLGLMHALDADHIMAVSGLSSLRGGYRDTLRFCLRWALGHGLVLMLVGAAVMGLGMAIPADVSHYAEQLVGLVLILIGLYVLWDLLRRRAHFHFHAHEDLPAHAHWHRHAPHQDSQPHRHQHGAVMVGMLHGTAGSAPLLALLPLSVQSSPLVGLSYLLVFGAGVLAAMLVFGGALSGLFRYVTSWGTRAMRLLRATVALGSIGFGAHLFYASLG